MKTTKLNILKAMVIPFVLFFAAANAFAEDGAIRFSNNAFKQVISKAADGSIQYDYVEPKLVLPDDVILSDGPVMFGVTAIDKDGNESDMASIAEPYQLLVPKAPGGVFFKPSDEFKLVDKNQPETRESRTEDPSRPRASDGEDPLAQAIEGNGHSQPARVKYYDDVGYRRTS